MLLTNRQRSPVDLATRVEESRYFCVQTDVSRDEFLYLGGYERCAADYEIERASFPFLTLEIVVAGQATLDLGGRRRALKPGDCFCFGPDLPLRIVSHPKFPLEKYFVVFGRNAFPRHSHPPELYPGCFFEGNDPAELSRWCALIYEEGASQSADAGANVASLIDVLVRKVTSNAEESIPIKGTDALVARALRKLDADFRALRSVQELADTLGVSPEHLCRAFRKSKHASPYRVLMRSKMAHAFTLLKLSSLSIQEIAESVGFSDAFHFSRAFKKQYGKAPSLVR